jgi:hypothetical protein
MHTRQFDEETRAYRASIKISEVAISGIEQIMCIFDLEIVRCSDSQEVHDLITGTGLGAEQ